MSGDTKETNVPAGAGVGVGDGVGAPAELFTVTVMAAEPKIAVEEANAVTETW